MLSLHSLRRAALDLLFPRDVHCALCGQDADPGLHCLCAKCAAGLDAPPVRRRNVDGLDAFWFAFDYEEPIRSAIHAFKYKNKRYLARFFVYHMSGLPLPRNVCLCAVPLHKARKKTRGYSQTDLLCEELSRICGLPWLRGALTRVRNTPSQTQLSGADRLVNLTDAFTASAAVAQQHILLVDDIVTTGSTMRECSKALKTAGAAWVGGCAVAE